MDLRGKVALVTGGASEYGKEFCKQLIRQGCKVSICDINGDDGQELLQQLSKIARDKVIFCSCDVTDYAQFEEAFKTTVTKLGGLDIVVNNASVMNDRLWELEVDVNLNGVIRGLLLAFRFLGRDRGGPGGVIVNIGSSSSSQPLVSLPIFTATKHAVAALTYCYGNEYHINLTGVRVVTLCPSLSERVITGDPHKKMLNGQYEQAWQHDMDGTSAVKVENMGKALIEVIEKAPSGSSWLIEGLRPPKKITLFT